MERKFKTPIEWLHYIQNVYYAEADASIGLTKEQEESLKNLKQ